MKLQLLGDAMREQRVKLNLTLDQVCDGICDTTSLYRIESNQQIPSHNRAKALLQRLNMPDDRYYALSSPHELDIANTRKELLSCCSRFERASAEGKHRTWELAMEQLHRLEELTEDDDTITRQFILSSMATLGKEDGPYSFEERQDLLLEALRLTIPKFNLEKIGGHRYTVDETRLINKIAGTYSDAGYHSKALSIYSQLYDYVRKFDDRLSNFLAHFTLITYNYARELCLLRYYHEGIKVAEEGRRASIDYGYFRFLPGFLALLGEAYYLLGEVEKSKKLWVQAHYLYEVLEDERSLRLIDPDIKARFHLEFPV